MSTQGRITPRRVLTERHGPYLAVINGKGRNVWGAPIDPTLRIVRITGPGIMDWEDAHLSTAHDVRKLRRRWARIKARVTA